MCHLLQFCPMRATPARRPGLSRVLGSWDGVAIAVGAIIGSGIFRTPGPVARETGSVGWALTAWILGGCLALIDALIIAELASMFPRAGGNYVYLRNAYGPFPAFLNGWLSTFVTYPASMAGLAVFFSECLRRLLTGGEGPLWPAAAGVLIGLTVVNGLGLRYGRATQAIFAVGKVVLLLAVVLLAFVLPAEPSGDLPPAPPRPAGMGNPARARRRPHRGDVDIRRVRGRCRHGGGDEEPRQVHPGGAHPDDAPGDGGLPAGQRGVLRGPALRGGGGLHPDRLRPGGGSPRVVGRDAGDGSRHGLRVRRPERTPAGGPPHHLCHLAGRLDAGLVRPRLSGADPGSRPLPAGRDGHGPHAPRLGRGGCVRGALDDCHLRHLADHVLRHAVAAGLSGPLPPTPPGRSDSPATPGRSSSTWWCRSDSSTPR